MKNILQEVMKERKEEREAEIKEQLKEVRESNDWAQFDGIDWKEEAVAMEGALWSRGVYLGTDAYSAPRSFWGKINQVCLTEGLEPPEHAKLWASYG